MLNEGKGKEKSYESNEFNYGKGYGISLNGNRYDGCAAGADGRLADTSCDV